MRYGILIGMLVLSGCGYSELGTEAVGQVKRVVKLNPILCNEYTVVDLSLGVMQNGVGSMSTHDVILTVESESDVTTLKTAAETGKLVKITYNDKRWTWCVQSKLVKTVSIIN